MGLSLAAWLRKLESIHPKTIEMGLERCSEVYQRLGSPRPANEIWVVGGTNGKGSVVAYLCALLSALGDSCGSFTSPHILRFNERIRISGLEVADDQIVEALERVEAARREISLTYFEFTTLAALLLFHQARLDAVVLEVGLGGRLDAVNLVDADCAVITTVDLDHMDYLGPDRESIGYEKAGIMRAGKPAVVGEPSPPASVVRQARELGASLLRYGVDFSLEPGAEGVRFKGVTGTVIELPAPGLPGLHQLQNLAVALASLEAVRPEALTVASSLAEGVRAATVAGRLQRWPADRRVILDVGHNPLAARAVAGFLADDRHHLVHCVLGMLADKDAEGVTSALEPWVENWYCGGLPGPRGQAGEQLAERVRGNVDRSLVTGWRDISDALQAALAAAGPSDVVLVFGSFETVGAATRWLMAQAKSG